MALSFDWRRCKDRPEYMYAHGQPVTAAHSEKLYIRGGRGTVLEYTPEHDQWAELPPPPVKSFTIATLRGQLLAVGGEEKCNEKKTNTILKFNEHSQQWIQSHPAMPTALTFPAVVGYQDHLIVVSGRGLSGYIPDVNILNTVSNQWIPAQPLPSTDLVSVVNTVLVQDTIYLVAKYTQTVLRAHVPTLISGAKTVTDVWEILPNTPYYRSSPVIIDNTLLTIGGSDISRGGKPTTSIQMYDPTTNQWTKVGDLPEPMKDCLCTVLSGEVFALGGYNTRFVYITTV